MSDFTKMLGISRDTYPRWNPAQTSVILWILQSPIWIARFRGLQEAGKNGRSMLIFALNDDQSSFHHFHGKTQKLSQTGISRKPLSSPCSEGSPYYWSRRTRTAQSTRQSGYRARAYVGGDEDTQVLGIDVEAFSLKTCFWPPSTGSPFSKLSYLLTESALGTWVSYQADT